MRLYATTAIEYQEDMPGIAIVDRDHEGDKEWLATVWGREEESEALAERICNLPNAEKANEVLVPMLERLVGQCERILLADDQDDADLADYRNDLQAEVSEAHDALTRAYQWLYPGEDPAKVRHIEDDEVSDLVESQRSETCHLVFLRQDDDRLLVQLREGPIRREGQGPILAGAVTEVPLQGEEGDWNLDLERAQCRIIKAHGGIHPERRAGGRDA